MGLKNVRASNEGIADLVGRECQTLVREKPNMRRQGDVALFAGLMCSLNCSGTCQRLIFNAL